MTQEIDNAVVSNEMASPNNNEIHLVILKVVFDFTYHAEIALIEHFLKIGSEFWGILDVFKDDFLYYLGITLLPSFK